MTGQERPSGDQGCPSHPISEVGKTTCRVCLLCWGSRTPHCCLWFSFRFPFKNCPNRNLQGTNNFGGSPSKSSGSPRLFGLLVWWGFPFAPLKGDLRELRARNRRSPSGGGAPRDAGPRLLGSSGALGRVLFSLREIGAGGV